MSSRKGIAQIRCSQPGCKEVARFAYGSAKEAHEIRSEQEGKWKCTRHSHPDELLGLDSLVRSVRLVNMRSKHPELDERFWDGRSGFVYGPGFMSFAKDFPEGAVLEVTARVILPEAIPSPATGQAAKGDGR